MNCVVCNAKATKRFSPDLDIQGIGSCAKHLDQVQIAYIALLQGDKDMYKSMIRLPKKKKKL